MISYYHNYNRELKTTLQYDTIKEVLDNYEAIVEQLPEKTNISFSLGNYAGGAKKMFLSSRYIFFDIDKIDLTKIDEYIDPICKAIKVDKDSLACICSGNGLHIILELQDEYTDPDYYKRYKKHYNVLCREIGKALMDKGLTGEPDANVFSLGKSARLPGCVNEKGNTKKETYLLFNNLKPSIKDLSDIVSLPKENISSSASDVALKISKHVVDTDGILSGCNFLKFCKENPTKVSEPEWYASLTILARAHGDSDINHTHGKKLCHDYSRGHKGYDVAETEAKIEQALNATGPRTCHNISEELNFSGCQDCKHFGKISTPLQIKSEDFIATESNGFRKITYTKDGTPKIGKIVYEDVLKAFKRDHIFKSIFKGAKPEIYIYNDSEKHYKLIIPTKDLEVYLQSKTEGSEERDFKEFFRKVQTSAENTAEFEWVEASRHKLNLENGVFDLETQTFKEGSGPEEFYDYRLDYKYDPEATCPEFDKFLQEVMIEDDQKDIDNKVAFLWEYFGYILSVTDPSTVEKTLFLISNGQSGKSTIIDVLTSMVTEELHLAFTLDDFKKEQQVAKLHNKMFAIAGEVSSRLQDSTQFKEATSGGMLTGKSIWKEPFSFKCKCKFLFASNTLPNFKDGSYGLKRKVAILNFRGKFKDKNHEGGPCKKYDIDSGEELYFMRKRSKIKLLETFKKERSGILNKVIEGYQRFKKNDFEFTEITSSKELYDQFKTNSDPLSHVLEFIHNDDIITITGNPDHYVLSQELYRTYTEYFKNTRTVRTVSQKAFSQKVMAMPDLSHLRDKNKNNLKKLAGKAHRVVYGILLNDNDDNF